MGYKTALQKTGSKPEAEWNLIMEIILSSLSLSLSLSLLSLSLLVGVSLLLFLVHVSSPAPSISLSLSVSFSIYLSFLNVDVALQLLLCGVKSSSITPFNAELKQKHINNFK